MAERATRLLVDAVVADSWRSEAAFTLANALPVRTMERMVAALPEDPRARSRILHEYGRALHRRGLKA